MASPLAHRRSCVLTKYIPAGLAHMVERILLETYQGYEAGIVRCLDWA